MKVSKVLGCVLGLHFGVVAILLVQPGCRTQQPPTQTYTQEHTMKSSVRGASRTPSGLIEAKQSDTGSSSGLDAAFNAGLDSEGYAPDEAGDEFSEFDDVAPIEPLPQGEQTVELSDDSFETYTIKKGDNLWSIAKRYDVSLNELYAANGLNKNSVLRVGQQIEIPVEGSTGTVQSVAADSYQPSSMNQGSTEYTVKRGDSLSKIARQFNTSVRAIKAANGKSSDLIRAEETLIIPVSGSSGNSGSSGSSATKPKTQSNRSSSNSRSSSSSTATSSGTRTHTVRSGEYPGTIARKYGMTTSELLALNGITDPRKLQVGQKLQVSGSGSAENVDSRTETVVSPRAATTEKRSTSTADTSSSSKQNSSSPVEIQVIEADPLLEGEAAEIKSDEMFEDAVEIPVIRLEDDEE